MSRDAVGNVWCALSLSLLFFSGCASGNAGGNNGGGGTTNHAALSANPTSIAAGNSSTLSWTCDAPAAIGVGFDTGGQASGSTSVKPTATTTYSLNCGNATPPTATVTVTAAQLISIALTSSTYSLNYSQTAQLTVAGTYTDQSQKYLTETATYMLNPQGFGSVSGTGVYTAPQQAGSVQITATVSGISSTPITITVSAPPPPTLTSVSPENLGTDSPRGIDQWTIFGTGFSQGGTFLDFLGEVNLPPGGSDTQITPIMALGTGYWSPGWLPWRFVTPPSNEIVTALLGPVNLLTFSRTGEIFNTDPANGITYKYKPDGTPDGQFTTYAYALAVDPTTGLLSTASIGTVATYRQDGTLVSGGGNDNRYAVSIAALNGLECALFLTRDNLYCTDTKNFNLLNAATKSDPTKVWMLSANGSTLAYVLDRSVHQLCKFTLTATQITPGTCVNVNGLSSGQNNFDLIFINATTAAVMDQAANTVTLLDATMGKTTWQSAVSGTPIAIAFDSAAHAIDVAISDPPNHRTTYAAIDIATGTVTQLPVSSQYLSVGFGVNPVTAKLVSCMRDKCELAH